MKLKIIFVPCLSTTKFTMLKNIYYKQTVFILFYDCCFVVHVLYIMLLGLLKRPSNEILKFSFNKCSYF